LSCFRRVFFIAAENPVKALAHGLPVTIVHNSHPELGQRETIRLGVSISEAAYYMFFPCDQPLLDQDTVLKVLDARSWARIVQPGFQGMIGSPVLFSRAFRDELLGLGHGEHGRDIKRRHPGSVSTIELSTQTPLLDIDTRETLERIELALR
jgi:molybdenum cofactor cytidylyltransferase